MNNIGYEKIRDVIYQALVQANADVKGGRGKFAKDTAKRIYDLNAEWQIGSDFPDELEPFVKRLEKGLGVGMLKRNARAAEIYRWLIEQESQGKNLETFFSWAKSEEQKKYKSKYYSNPDYLKVDFPRAFDGTQISVTQNSDGSLYV